MSGVTLRVDTERWRAHLREVYAAHPGIVIVAKGNGYGLGLPRLAAEATRLGATMLAVGVADEVAAVRDHFAGDLLVLTPWRPGEHVATGLLDDPRVITIVSRVADLEAIAAGPDGSEHEPRVLVEVLTSLQRHGVPLAELTALEPLLDRVSFEGWTLHLPYAGDTYAEAATLGSAALAVRQGPVFVSHVPTLRLGDLAAALGSTVRPRIGTKLWHGDMGALPCTATVLDVHRVRRGERAGYRHRPVPGDGWVVVVAGGTAQGVALEAPTAARTARQRLVALAGGALGAAGRALSPYTVDGRKRWFLETPHMQSSQLWLPAPATPPAIGDEIPVQLRLTTAAVDRVVG